MRLSTWMVFAGLSLLLLGCARKLDDDLCSALRAKGKECKAPYFTAVVDEMCKALDGKAVADAKILDRYLEMPCSELSVEFVKDMEAAVKEGEKSQK